MASTAKLLSIAPLETNLRRSLPRGPEWVMIVGAPASRSPPSSSEALATAAALSSPNHVAHSDRSHVFEQRMTAASADQPSENQRPRA